MANPLKIFAAAIVLSLTAFAAQAIELTKPEQQKLQEVNQYLNQIGSLVADFTQVSPDGTVGYGRFFLKRPGKFRWQYDPPIPLLIVGNGPKMAYQDLELNQVSHLPTDENMAALLAKPNVDLGRDLDVQAVESNAGSLRVSLRERGKNGETGSLTLVLSQSPMRLEQLEIYDPVGNLTRVSLNNMQLGQDLPNRLFVIDESERLLKRQRGS